MNDKILSLEQEWAQRFPERPKLLVHMRNALGVDEVKWEHMTTSGLGKIHDYITETVSSNSAKTYMAIIKSFLVRYSDDGIVPCKNPHRVLKAKSEPSQHIALTEEEVERFSNYVPETQTERDVKILFMRACLTGARFSDAENFSMDNINGEVFSYVSKKTKTEVILPVHHLLPQYLKEQPKMKHHRSNCSKIVQRICQRIGMDEVITLYVRGKKRTGPKWLFCTFHSARRSFVSNLAIRDVNLSLISKMAGHSSTAMTDRYLAFNVKNPGTQAMQFFNGE